MIFIEMTNVAKNIFENVATQTFKSNFFRSINFYYLHHGTKLKSSQLYFGACYR